MFRTRTVRQLAASWMLLVVLGLIISFGIMPLTDWLPEVTNNTGKQWLETYNGGSHLVFVGLLTLGCFSLLRLAHINAIDVTSKEHPTPVHRLTKGIQKHPLVTGLFAFYTILMMRQASWFYKEIIGWYEDVLQNHLLDNFSLRWSFIKETMYRNDFRFFPLSHQDLHILSWFTPYVSVWMLVNAIELFTIVILGAKTVQLLSQKKSRRETYLVFSILFLFDAATGYTFFQFIYSERIVVLLLSIFTYYFTRSFLFGHKNDQYLALTTALVGLFFKDTAFLLFTVPAFSVLAAGNAGLLNNRPKLVKNNKQAWIDAYRLELSLISLLLVLSVSYLYLSYLPSLHAGIHAYDSHLRWSRFEADWRFIALAGMTLTRAGLIMKRRANFSALDALNAGAIAYALGLFAMVGFRSTNYMALPVQYIATLNLVVLLSWICTWMEVKGRSASLMSIGAVMASAGLIGIEHLGRKDFQHRISKMHTNQDSWVKTLDQMDAISQDALTKGKEINIIYSKSWFRDRGHIEALKYNRLIYYNLDTGTYTIKDGTDKGSSYTPKPGDYLLNIDTGKRLEEFGFDMKPYKKIWDYGKHKNNGKIYEKVN